MNCRALITSVLITVSLAACASPTPTPTQTAPAPTAPPFETVTASTPTAVEPSEVVTDAVISATPTPLLATSQLLLALPSANGAPLPTGARMRLGLGTIETSAVSPDRSALAVGTSAGMFVYRVDTFAPIWGRMVQRPIREIAWSPDSRFVAARFQASSEIIIWATPTGITVNTFEHSGWIDTMAWSPDSSRIAIGWGGNHFKDTFKLPGHVTVWDVDSNQQLLTLDLPYSPETLGSDYLPTARALAWSHDGRILVGTCSDCPWIDADNNARGDGKAVLWDATTGETQHVLQHDVSGMNAITTVEFSPDNHLLLTTPGMTGSGDIERPDNRVFLWNAKTGELDHVLTRDHGWVFSHAWSPDGKYLVTGSGGRFKLEDELIKWDVSTGQPIQVLAQKEAPFRSVAWSPDGTKLVSGTSNYWGPGVSKLSMWEANTGVLQYEVETPEQGIDDLVWLPYGKSLIVGTDSQVAALDSTTGFSQRYLASLSDILGIDEVKWSADGRQLAAIDRKNRGDRLHVVVWDVQTGSPLRQFDDKDAFAASPDAQNFPTETPASYTTSSDNNNHLIVTDQTGQTILQIDIVPGMVINVAFSPDGTLMAVGGGIGIVQGGPLATGGEENNVTIWNLKTRSAVQQYYGHTGTINSLAFSPDGKYLATGSADGTVIIWNASP